MDEINPDDYLRDIKRCQRCNKYNATIIPDNSKLVAAIAQQGVESFLESNFELQDEEIREKLQENMEAMAEITKGEYCKCPMSPASINKWKI